ACGENPKRVYGNRNSAPASRMGNVAGYRQTWAKAESYRRKWDSYLNDGGEMPDRDLQMDTLAEVLRGNISVHNHCYRADEMAVMLDVAKEFNYKVTAFHHATEAYKIADLLAESGTCAAMWADWWGFKMEAYDAIRENVALVEKAGACAIVHSDSDIGIQRLNQEAAKAMAAGNRAGIAIAPEKAISWITLNPARSLGIDKQTGSLEKGKNADAVIWDANPFSVYARAEKVFIDGALVYDRLDQAVQPVSDFSLGTRDDTGGQP
ncbi:MAG: amidohydrolase family protein, partial [Gammaproteobacteria bacterium]|nr:amidohydrolase family protein [Gammaproteobacteria bacterium]